MSDSQVESTSLRPARRHPRGLVACLRCKSRKQRCDNAFPACSNCHDAGEKCSYGTKQAYPAEYVRSLERQISRLKDELALSRRNGVCPASSSSMQQQQTLPMVPSMNERTNSGETATSDLKASAGIVALSPDSFLGTSSGYPLTKLLRPALPSVDAHQSDRAVTLHQVNAATRSSVVMRVDGVQQAGGDQVCVGSDLPSKEVGDKLIEAYYARVHPKHPFLPRKRVQSLHEARHELVPAHKAVRSEGVEGRCDYATLQLVYAIGARYLQLSNDDDHSSPTVRLYSQM
jgi:hypothetical protein